MSTFLLIHGAWHGAWCWQQLAPRLVAAGHRVVAPDLPGHGCDGTSSLRVTLSRFSRAVREAARAQAEPVIALGHSMGGVAITQAAHDEPSLFAGLVYLCAFVPAHGESLLSLARRDPASLVRRATRWRSTRVTVAPDGAREAFYADCSEEDARWAVERLGSSPVLPMLQKVSLRPSLELPKAYVECRQDRAISLAAQRRMAADFSAERIVSMETGHSPFLSAPGELAEKLTALAARMG